MTYQRRFYETERLAPGTKVYYSGYLFTVQDLYEDGPYEAARMYNIRNQDGDACVCGSDLIRA